VVYKWMLDGVVDKVPELFTHSIAVGSIILNKNRDKVLIVKEARGLRKHCWSLAGGMVNIGETI